MKRNERMNKINPAEVCENTRRFTSEAFLAAIRPIWETSFSEKQLKDRWIAELRKNESLFSSGWYSPPPDGQDNFVFDPVTGLAYVYASAVDRATGVIGHWGMTLYAGGDTDIILLLQRVYRINQQIADSIKPGLTVNRVYNEACEIFTKLFKPRT